MVTLILLWALGHGLLDQGFARKYPCSTNLLDQMRRQLSWLWTPMVQGVGVCSWQGRVIWSECFHNTHRANQARIQPLWGPQKVLLKCINPSHRRARGGREARRNRGVDGRNVMSSSILFTSPEA